MQCVNEGGFVLLYRVQFVPLQYKGKETRHQNPTDCWIVPGTVRRRYVHTARRPIWSSTAVKFSHRYCTARVFVHLYCSRLYICIRYGTMGFYKTSATYTGNWKYIPVWSCTRCTTPNTSVRFEIVDVDTESPRDHERSVIMWSENEIHERYSLSGRCCVA